MAKYHIASLYLCVKDMERAINCLPSISVESIDVLKSKIRDLELCFPLTQIGNNWVAEFVDSEGNCIELTTAVL